MLSVRFDFESKVVKYGPHHKHPMQLRRELFEDGLPCELCRQRKSQIVRRGRESRRGVRWREMRRRRRDEEEGGGGGVIVILKPCFFLSM